MQVQAEKLNTILKDLIFYFLTNNLIYSFTFYRKQRKLMFLNNYAFWYKKNYFLLRDGISTRTVYLLL